PVPPVAPGVCSVCHFATGIAPDGTPYRHCGKLQRHRTTLFVCVVGWGGCSSKISTSPRPVVRRSADGQNAAAVRGGAVASDSALPNRCSPAPPQSADQHRLG